MTPEQLNILVCPVTKGKLIYNPATRELISQQIKLAFPIRDGIPVLLESEARVISAEEYACLS